MMRRFGTPTSSATLVAATVPVETAVVPSTSPSKARRFSVDNLDIQSLWNAYFVSRDESLRNKLLPLSPPGAQHRPANARANARQH